MNLERFVRHTFRHVGLDVKRASLPGSSIGLTLNLVDFSRADIVFDVGANEGQFAQELIAFRPRIKIVSFEPVSAAHASLIKNACGNPNWIVAERVALGEIPAQSEIYVTQNSQCSSLRGISDNGIKFGSSFDLRQVQVVQIERFDNICRHFIDRQSWIYLKIDVQGGEKEVMSGTLGVTDQIVGIQAEISFHEIYAGQSTGFEVVEDILGDGFDIYGISNGWRDGETGKLLQADAFFIQRGLSLE
jgi:FkbM family methyltransferase